jgi:hypothetical protein
MVADRRSDNKKVSFDRAVLFELFTISGDNAKNWRSSSLEWNDQI